MITYGPRGHNPPSREQRLADGRRNVAAYLLHVADELRQPLKPYVPSAPSAPKIVLMVGRDGMCAVDLDGRRQTIKWTTKQLMSKDEAEELVLQLLEKFPTAEVNEVVL
jgi:hypothetical protein